MPCIATVGIYDDLPSGQAAVTLRAAYYKTSSWVNQILGVFIQQFCRDDWANDICHNICRNLFRRNFRGMLGGNYNCIHANRTIAIIFYGNLCFSIRTQVTQFLFLSHSSQLHRQFMCQRNRQRHQFAGFIASKSKHHALVTGTGFMFVCCTALQCIVNTHCNVRRLLINCSQNGAS